MSLLGSKKVLRNKRGQIDNYMAVILFLVLFSMLNIIAMVLLSEINDEWSKTSYYNPQIEAVFNDFLDAIRLFDNILVVMLFVLIVGVVLTSFKINTSPAFFVISIIGGIFFMFISLFFNLYFKLFVSEPVLTAALINFPKTIFICSNLQWVALLTFIVGSLALYAKRDKGEFIR